MSTIRHHKRQARLRATAKGTSLQSELNAISREHGHSAWGDFQAALRAKMSQSLGAVPAEGFMRPDESTVEIDAIADAFEVARQRSAHLVVLRPAPRIEVEVIKLISGAADQTIAARFKGAWFVDEITDKNIAEAKSAGKTLVAGSGDMPRDTDQGNFVVTAPDHHLRQGQSIVSKRDRDIIYATTAAKRVQPQGDRGTVEIVRDLAGSTTIRRTRNQHPHGRDDHPASPSTHFRSIDAGDMGIEVEWDAAKTEPDADIVDTLFAPAFNVLGPEFLPDGEVARTEHIERIASILLPDKAPRRDHFHEKGRAAMIGFLHVEIGRAVHEGRGPSIPALIDWIGEGLANAQHTTGRTHPEGGEAVPGDPLSQWLHSIVREAVDTGYGRSAVAGIAPLVDMAPNERYGILGAMDKGFLPFKNRHVRNRTS